MSMEEMTYNFAAIGGIVSLFSLVIVVAVWVRVEGVLDILKDARGMQLDMYFHGCYVDKLKGTWKYEETSWRGRKGTIATVGYFKCSNCGGNSEEQSRFCPNCGADMGKRGAE